MTQQTTPSGWHLRAGRERDNRWALIEGDGVTWVADRAFATRFEAKAEAAVHQMEIVAELGIQVMVVSDCPKAAQQDEAKRQMLDGALAALHERGALTRDSAEGVGTLLRCGPGPDRLRANAGGIAAVNAAAEW